MIVYDYNPETFIYQGTIWAIKDPLDTWRFIHPAHSTTVKPPEPKENIVYCYNLAEDSWYEVPDYRGQTWYDEENNEVLITEIGDVRQGLSNEKYVIQPTKSELYDYLSKVRYEGETDYLNIFKVSFKNTRINQNKWHYYFYLAKNDDKFTLEWKNLNREFVTLSASDIIEINDYITKYVESWFEIEKKAFVQLEKEKITTYDDINTFINKYKGFKP